MIQRICGQVLNWLVLGKNLKYRLSRGTSWSQRLRGLMFQLLDFCYQLSVTKLSEPRRAESLSLGCRQQLQAAWTIW